MVLSSGKGMKMKVQKYEIARVIDKLKSIVQKNDQFPALGGILVKDGYLIASNSEITMKVKLEASEGSYFIIPMKAFDLIKNLPDGEIDISATDKNVVMIKIGAIKNKYQSYPPEEFNFDITEDPEADGVELNGKKIMEASVNAMLSFAYSLLAGMCGSALEAVGLDSYVGFFHTDRPGRISLALDLMEEFRSVMADRFVLTLINKKIMKPEYFIKKENGAVIMNDEGRKVFLSAWQSKKQETIKHPFLGEKIEWGMAPYVQSLLLARFLRGDLDEYPPFFWK